ncbi:MAG: GNAT family N-acetyltransferase [Chloroflexales bacterium]|nr:GNAT family N-acetyltransferase [Chloroflexales bacterium]
MSDESRPLTIARATLDHLPVVAPLFDGYRVFYGQPPDLARATDFIRERLERGESAIFVALGDGAGLGFTQLYPSFSSVSAQRLWILNDLFVAPTARRQGVAEALLDRARQFGVESGAKSLELATAVDNYAAQRVYERLGWQRDNEFFHYELPLG